MDNYPLAVGGVDDYPVKVGSMLLTMVDPEPGFERAYNRWYERDHYYAGCMIGPWLFAGSRWVAPRSLKDLRWPTTDSDASVARPVEAGSYVSIYWVEQGHHEDHFDVWAVPQVRDLYAQGRGFPNRKHVHTVLYEHIGDTYRDADPVPVTCALDHAYDGIVLVWLDATDGDATQLNQTLAQGLIPELVGGSGIEIVSAWTPWPGENDPKEVPMDLGSRAGGPNRLCLLTFVHGDVRDTVERFQRFTQQIEAQGLATTAVVAPFFRTVIGTDTYTDELW